MLLLHPSTLISSCFVVARRLWGCASSRSHYRISSTVQASSSLGGGDRLDVENGAEQVLDNVALALLAGLLNLLDLLLCLLVGLVLGLRVALAVLQANCQSASRQVPGLAGDVTSASNFLYSSSLDVL